MRISLYIAKRFLFAKSGLHAVNLISRIAGFVVVVAVAAFFTILSVFSGLKEFGLSFSTAFDPDLKVVAAKGKTFEANESQLAKLEQLEGVVAYTKIIEERVMLHYKDKNTFAYLNGVDTNFGKVISADSVMALGRWFEKGLEQAVVGYGIANTLNLGLFHLENSLDVVVPKKGTSNALSLQKPFRIQSLMPVGIYQISEELDKKFVFTDIAFAQKLLELPSRQVSYISLKLEESYNEKVLVAAIQEVFGEEVIVKDKEQLNETLYKMLNTEVAAIYSILTLILIIALFNVVGSVIMTVLDKKSHLKTLYNLGTPVLKIRRIFFLHGFVLTVISGALGLFVGLVVVGAQQYGEWIVIPGTELPYPVILEWKNLALVTVTFVLLGGLASKTAASVVRKNLLS
ncbi:MAG: ABC transporter permease [Flavobacteriaceae bacterium]|nr:ABC transporter permease [Flavobacteriaceae bacterium]MDG2314748.1 ABC transporter permease [Flavobacteriaceae bacterium]